MLKFYYNGIKGTDGKLQTCFYSTGPLKSYPEGTISIYKREYTAFTQEVRNAFTVENESDGMTDYFETDTIRVVPTHPLYRQVSAAVDKLHEHNLRQAGKRFPTPTYAATDRPGDAAAVMQAETGIDYARCLVMCNCD